MLAEKNLGQRWGQDLLELTHHYLLCYRCCLDLCLRCCLSVLFLRYWAPFLQILAPFLQILHYYCHQALFLHC